ncbi:unnamed protein product [Camellia sinensis]
MIMLRGVALRLRLRPLCCRITDSSGPFWTTAAALDSPKYTPSQSGGGRSRPVSARKLAATLWEMNEVPSPRVGDNLEEKKAFKREMRVRERMGVPRSVHSGSLPPHLSDPSHSPVSEKMKNLDWRRELKDAAFSRGILDTGAQGCINDSLLTGLQFVEGFESFFFVKRWTMHQLKIKNPNYQRKWKTPMIDNPEFKDDPEIYVFPKLKYVGIELWQVKSRTLFDNVLICDDPDYAMKLAEETWGKQKDAEKAAFDEAEKKREEEESKDDPVDSDAEGDDDEIDKDADITEESAHDEL